MLRLLDGLPWVPSTIYLFGALWVTAFPAQSWAALSAASRLALAAALVYCVTATFFSGGFLAGSAAVPIMTLLIAFLGWVIGAYSRRYLRGEVGQLRFTIAFLATLAAVSAVAASTNLGVLIAAWAASSVGLHHLLTFYRERPAAIIVAHKKFLASRLAEALLIIAAVLLYNEWGTLDIAATIAHAQPGMDLPPAAGLAAVLIAVAALLKCAQLPLHGWLIQVMEAPTPVSALLHAGVVNLGGYVLIRLAPLIAASTTAQTLLVVVGGLTAALAGLVMLTRITIKVRLAWSTCSQMGFMLLECGLGLYDLALLHLVAHALYKAYAFLTAGEAVSDALTRRLIAPAGQDIALQMPWGRVLALPIAWVLAAGSAVFWQQVLGLPQVPWIATVLLACGLATVLWTPAREPWNNGRGVLALLAGAQLYIGWHWVMTEALGVATFPPDFVLACGALLLFIALYVAQIALSTSRSATANSVLYDWIYAGLYLDERFTRLTFRLWPVHTK